MAFSQTIISWYQRNKRELPWRNTRNPYRIWLSEIILQQTRVEQGLPYFKKFIKRYPDVKKLAAAKEGEVLKLWQGLGYYSRARNLHHTAKEISKKHKGIFPQTWNEVRALKGIGDYTVAAILSFAFDKKYPVVDGNVHRLLSRYLGIKTPLHTAKAKKQFYEAALAFMNAVDDKDNAVFNQAIMEFGSRMCKPANPDCMECPLNDSCYAFARNKVKQLPVKKKKSQPANRYFHFFVYRYKDKFVVQQRKEDDIWKNMYQFPLLEMKNAKKDRAFCKSLRPLKELKISSMKHKLSHQTIHATFYELAGADVLKQEGAYGLIVSQKNLRQYPLPRLIDRYLQENF
jgi:A/G-specific adenine glycosylase